MGQLPYLKHYFSIVLSYTTIKLPLAPIFENKHYNIVKEKRECIISWPPPKLQLTLTIFPVRNSVVVLVIQKDTLTWSVTCVSATLKCSVASALLTCCITSATLTYCVASATLNYCIASATLTYCGASATLTCSIADSIARLECSKVGVWAMLTFITLTLETEMVLHNLTKTKPTKLKK